MFKKTTFKRKMMLIPILAGLCLVAIVAVTVVQGRRVEALLARIQTGYSPALEASRDLEENLGRIQRLLQDAVASEDSDLLDLADRERDAFLKRVQSVKDNAVIDPVRVETLTRTFGDYYAFAQATTRQLLERQLLDTTSLDTRAEDLRTLTVKYKEVKGMLVAGTQRDKDEMRLAFEAAGRLLRNSTAVTTVVILLMLAALVIVARRIVAGVAGPLAILTEAAGRIVRDGDLSHSFVIDSEDEIGLLATSFRAMVEKVRTMYLTLQGAVKDLSLAVGTLNAVTTDQTSSLQEQASGLVETSATAQEIKQTSALSATKAEAVLEVAVKAEQLSATGQQSIEASIEGLQAIRTQVDAMVASITELSGRTQLVGEIIERVKDIADQSNMLALNAAIEATKAGEYGKSFAVVAREIRTLADQSLQSTGRIREILSEIQGAIRTTAERSSQGVRRVEEGTEQIRNSGDTLRQIMQIVDQSAQAARQIVAAVNQQNAGVAQISIAVTGLNSAMEITLGGVGRIHDSTTKINTTSETISTLLASFRV